MKIIKVTTRVVTEKTTIIEHNGKKYAIIDSIDDNHNVADTIYRDEEGYEVTSYSLIGELDGFTSNPREEDTEDTE